MSATFPLSFVLCLRIDGSLPLHVRWRVSPAARERQDVVNHVAGAAVRVSSGALEGVLRFGGA